MTTCLAKHYIVRPTGHYQIKVFKRSIGIERQAPRESNLLFKRTEYLVYDENAPTAPMAWDTLEIDRLIAAYEVAIKLENEVSE